MLKKVPFIKPISDSGVCSRAALLQLLQTEVTTDVFASRQVHLQINVLNMIFLSLWSPYLSSAETLHTHPCIKAALQLTDAFSPPTRSVPNKPSFLCCHNTI